MAIPAEVEPLLFRKYNGPAHWTETMDFGFVRFLLKLERTVMTILARVQELITFLTQKEALYLAQIADLRQQLEIALGNDAADAAAIEAARLEAANAAAAAAEAQARADGLQVKVDEDVAEDEAVIALIDSVVSPVEPPLG